MRSLTRSLSLLCLLATGCATMVNGRSQMLSVDSYPSRAEITPDCGGAPRVAGVTPAKVEVKRAADRCELTFTRNGYETKVIELTHQESRVTRLNAAFGLPSAIVLGLAGALIGSTVDGMDTGAEMGMDAGLDLGRRGATALDKQGGGWKWVPARIFVILQRSTPEDSAASDSGAPDSR